MALCGAMEGDTDQGRGGGGGEGHEDAVSQRDCKSTLKTRMECGAEIVQSMKASESGRKREWGGGTRDKGQRVVQDILVVTMQ